MVVIAVDVSNLKNRMVYVREQVFHGEFRRGVEGARVACAVWMAYDSRQGLYMRLEGWIMLKMWGIYVVEALFLEIKAYATQNMMA